MLWTLFVILFIMWALGMVTLRLVFSAIILLLVFRPSPRARTRADWLSVLAFGVVLAAMNGLFYLALTQHLTRTSEFADSRRALLLVARTLFRADPPAALRRKTKAIESAFSAVGIG